MSIPSSLLKRRRIEMLLSRQGVPDIPLLGRYNHTRAEVALPEHDHGGIVEICYLVKGRQTYRVAGRNYHLRGGDVFVAFPHERHGSAGTPEEKGVLYWMMVRKPRRGLLGLPGAQSLLLWKSLCGVRARHFRGTPGMKEHLDALTVLSNGPDFALRSTYLTSEALGFLLELLKSADPEHQTSRKAANSMGKVCRFVEDHLEDSMSVTDLAALAGLSAARFKVRFKEETGIPPGEFVLRAKIEEARRRLASGRYSVTEAAYALDFSSSQYFATVFKRFTGLRPRDILPALPRRKL